MNPNKRGGLNMTLSVQDEGWNKLATWKWNTADIKTQNRIIRTLEDAFGVKLKTKTDIDWMK